MSSRSAAAAGSPGYHGKAEYDVFGLFSWSSTHATTPIALTRVISAAVGPKVACCRSRAACWSAVSVAPRPK